MAVVQFSTAFCLSIVIVIGLLCRADNALDDLWQSMALRAAASALPVITQ
jgi:hypothetical protein